jgi:hypothetical protein
VRRVRQVADMGSRGGEQSISLSEPCIPQAAWLSRVCWSPHSASPRTWTDQCLFRRRDGPQRRCLPCRSAVLPISDRTSDPMNPVFFNPTEVRTASMNLFSERIQDANLITVLRESQTKGFPDKSAAPRNQNLLHSYSLVRLGDSLLVIASLRASLAVLPAWSSIPRCRPERLRDPAREIRSCSRPLRRSSP